MIDADGYRPNVGIIIANDQNQLLWCRRLGKSDAWQFPQGGIRANETPEKAMYRELTEELGLTSSDVHCLAQMKDWVSYLLPEAYRRYHSKPLCIGQKQKWFLLRLVSPDTALKLDLSEDQEFDQWRWVDYWYPKDHVIAFKRAVYQTVLTEFATVLDKERAKHS